MNTAQVTETPAPAKLRYRAGYCYITLAEGWCDYGSIERCSKAGPKVAIIQRRGLTKGGELFRESGHQRANKRAAKVVEITDAEAATYIDARQRLFEALGCPQLKDWKQREAYIAGLRGLALGLFGDRLPEGVQG
jgi:hypothetical protein